MPYLFSLLEELLLVKRFLVYEKNCGILSILAGFEWSKVGESDKLGRPDDVWGVNSWLALSASPFPV